MGKSIFIVSMSYNCEVFFAHSALNNDSTTTFTDDDSDSDAPMALEIVMGSISPKKKSDKNISPPIRKKNASKNQNKPSAKKIRGKVLYLFSKL